MNSRNKMSGCSKGNNVLKKSGDRKFLQSTTKAKISPLACHRGTKCIAHLIDKEVHGALMAFLENVFSDAVTYAEYCRRKNISPEHIIHALRKQGYTLYGYNA